MLGLHSVFGEKQLNLQQNAKCKDDVVSHAALTIRGRHACSSMKMQVTIVPWAQNAVSTLQWGDYPTEMVKEGFPRRVSFELGFEGQMGVRHGEKVATWKGHPGVGKRMNNVFICLINMSCSLLIIICHLILATTLWYPFCRWKTETQRN